MSPQPQLWDDLLRAWRARDWQSGIDLLQPLVEELPDVLGTRYMLASLCLRADNTGMAVLHYEKLLVLAVGQGDLFRALAAQRRLDELRDASPHAKRYAAMQQWFRALPVRRRERKRQVGLTAAMLLSGNPTDFTRLAESCSIETVEPDTPRTESATDMLGVLLFGRVRWTFEPANESPLPSVIAAEGDTLVAPAAADGDLLRMVAEYPAEILRFGAGTTPALRAAIERSQKPAPGIRSEPPRAPRVSDARPAAERAAAPLASTVRPVLDPRLEPEHASAAPHERLSHHQLDVGFEQGDAHVGIAGTRVASIPGRLLDLSPAGMTLGFPRAMLRQSREVLEGSTLTALIHLPGDSQPLHLLTRITSLTFDASSGPSAKPSLARMTIDFVLLLAHDRARIQGALIDAARDGRWPGGERLAANSGEGAAA